MKQPSLEDTLIKRINEAKEVTQAKYFKQFCNAVDKDTRDDIGAKMKVIDSVIFDLTKGIRGKLD